MIQTLSFIIKVEIFIFILIVFLYIFLWFILHALFYFIRYYEIANYSESLEKNKKWQENILLFISETASSIYLHSFNIWRYLKRYLSPEKYEIHYERSDGRNPLILVHGYNQNSGTMSCMKKKLERQYNMRNIFYLEFGDPFANNIEKIRGEFRKYIIDIFDSLKDHRVDFLCHCTGGVLLLDFLSGNEKYIQSISKIILLGSPINGTKTAVFSKNSLAEAMRYKSEFIQSLNYDKIKKLSVYSLYSSFDEFILPYYSSRLPDNTTFHNLEFSGMGHMNLLISGLITETVSKILFENKYKGTDYEQKESYI